MSAADLINTSKCSGQLVTDKKPAKDGSHRKEFLTPTCCGKTRARTRSCESNVKLQNVIMLDYLKKFVNAEKNFSIERLKKSVSSYDKFNKCSSKECGISFERTKVRSVDTPSDLRVASPLEPVAPKDASTPELSSDKNNSPPSSTCDKKVREFQRKKRVIRQDPSSLQRCSGTFWEFVLSMCHDKRLHWFMQPMNWIKLSGEILLYENNFKVLTRKIVICNFSIETPFISRAVTEVGDSERCSPRVEMTSSFEDQSERSDRDCPVVVSRRPERHFWIDTTTSYNFRVSDENLNNFNLIIFIIPNPVAVDPSKEDFNNGWKLITVVVPRIHLGVQNICHCVHDVPYPDRIYNRRGVHQPWWSYHFQVLWESNSRKKCFAAWNGVLEFQNPFDQIHQDGLEAKVLISSAPFHSHSTPNSRFVPRPSLCNHDSFVERSSLTTVRDISLPRSLRRTAPSTIRVPSFSYFIALPKAYESAC